MIQSPQDALPMIIQAQSPQDANIIQSPQDVACPVAEASACTHQTEVNMFVKAEPSGCLLPRSTGQVLPEIEPSGYLVRLQ